MKEKDIPEGYKDSTLGVIPKEWEIKRLGEICSHFKSGTTITSKQISEKGKYPVYGGNGLRGYSDTYTHDGAYILIGRQGALCGNINYVEGRNYISEHAIAVQSFENIQWLKYKLDYWNLNKFSESSAQPGLSVEKLVRYKLIVPPINEQKKIAEILSVWDDAIEKQTRLIDALICRKRALMQQLLTGKKRLLYYTEPWKQVRLGNIFCEVNAINDKQQNYPVMTISAKLGLVSQQNKFDRIIAGNSLNKYTLLKKDDFAYNKGNSKTYPMGCIYKLDEYEYALVPFVYICFQKTAKINISFYQQWFINHGLDKQLKRIITSGARGDGLLNVDRKDFFNTTVPFPHFTEQQVIATILATADLEIELVKKRLDQFGTQKRSLMQQLLTGKKRIKT
ncbi:restriction endonuclease subunit S [Bacteroides sp.]|uniref:restriction endonuclease subunit S n=1 Tax=Bacteroides sp. TaxID=29523 RepID=UPI002626F07A|nr:restriction endonuclease subunit S [Bacteroides sp.]MDD3036957.1 restriction endonuclease subunit S [Bacteroides sp.]